jgi:hypothetical protein
LKQLINSTFDNLTFDATLFPVPAENQLSFCNNLDTSSIDSFKTDLTNVAKYGTYIIIGFAGVLIGLNCLLIWYRWRSMKKHLERTRGAWVSDPVLNPNGFSESSPSAPQVTHSDRNLMMSQASAPQGNLSDRNLMMPQAAFPSAPQVPLSDRNLMMSQAASPSTPQGNLSGHNLMMSQASVPQGNLSGHNLMMSQASAPQGNLSDHNLMMPQASAPQGNLSDHNLMMPQASAPQGNLNDHNLMMSQATSPSAPQVTLSNHNMMMLQADSEHPVITRIMYFLAARTGMTPSQNIDMRWFFHYIFHPPALACFLIGFFGLLSVMIQLLLLGPLLSAARTEIDVAVSELSGIIVNAINTTMYNQSATYANDINSKVDVVQNTINHGLFGWVNGTTTLLNNSINSFYTDVQDFISNLFNGTVLEDPALDFLQCIIGNKVADIEDALTFLSDNLVINIPRVSQDVLVLSAPTVNEVTSPIASAAAGSGSSGGDQGLLGDVVSLYEDSLKSEAVLFGIFMGLWGIVVLTAICILLWRVHKRNKAAAAAAAKRQRVNPEVQVELKHMEGSEFSFSNDEKNDPVIY